MARRTLLGAAAGAALLILTVSGTAVAANPSKPPASG